jgi:hypothetical protein
MKKKLIIFGGIALGALGIAWQQGLLGGGNSASKSNFVSSGGSGIDVSQLEGMLLKTIPYNYRSSYVYGGKRYEITSDKGWSALNSRVGNLIGKTIELDINIVNQIPLGGSVSDTGQLIPR